MITEEEREKRNAYMRKYMRDYKKGILRKKKRRITPNRNRSKRRYATPGMIAPKKKNLLSFEIIKPKKLHRTFYQKNLPDFIKQEILNNEKFPPIDCLAVGFTKNCKKANSDVYGMSVAERGWRRCVMEVRAEERYRLRMVAWGKEAQQVKKATAQDRFRKMIVRTHYEAIRFDEQRALNIEREKQRLIKFHETTLKRQERLEKIQRSFEPVLTDDMRIELIAIHEQLKVKCNIEVEKAIDGKENEYNKFSIEITRVRQRLGWLKNGTTNNLIGENVYDAFSKLRKEVV